jgi:hypothetical protein
VTTYTKRGLGDSLNGLAALFAELDPGKNNGPNEGIHVEFENGVTLSLVWGWGTYASPTTVEVAVIGVDDEWITKAVAKTVFGEDIGDDVDGYCDAERVHSYFLTAQAWEVG